MKSIPATLLLLLSLCSAPGSGLGEPALQQPTASVFEQPVSLDVQDVEVRTVLTSLAEMAKLNIVFDPAISGRVTIHFVDVPWRTAFTTILRLKGLGAVWEGGKLARVEPLGIASGPSR